MLSEEINPDYFYIGEILKVNKDMKIPDYYILTFNKSNNKEIKFWAEDFEILKKANSKEKQLLKNKQKLKI